MNLSGNRHLASYSQQKRLTLFLKGFITMVGLTKVKITNKGLT